MRTNSPVYNDFNQSPVKELRLVVEFMFDIPLFVPSHDDIPNLPLSRYPSGLVSVSSTSQRLSPLEGRATIGTMTFKVIDDGSAFTSILQVANLSLEGLKGLRVRLWRGGVGMDWSEFRIEQTQEIDGNVTLKDDVYTFRCLDLQRRARQEVFDPAVTTLAADFLAGDTVLSVFDTSAFQPVPQGPSFTEANGGGFYYLKIKYQNGFEIVRATGRSDTTFTGLARGRFGTNEVNHMLPDNATEDNSIEVEQYVYLELPAPALALAILTGDMPGTAVDLPDNYHCGIDLADIDVDSFNNIGSDLYDTSDLNAGFIPRFEGLQAQDGKQFVEKELCLLMGAFLVVLADGRLSLRRMTNVTRSADYVVELGPSNIVSHGELTIDYSEVANVYSIDWSYFEPQDGDPRYLRNDTLFDTLSIARNGISKPVEFEFRGLNNERHTRTTVINRFNSLRDRYAGPPLKLSVELLPSMNDIEVGDIARVDLTGTLRDFHSEGTFADAAVFVRSMEVQQITVNQLSGRVRAQLFGSSLPAGPLADPGAGEGFELPDGWYSDGGTDLDGFLTVDASGFVTADGTLVGGQTSRAVYYYEGDLTINTGVTITCTGNVEIRVRGQLQINGRLVAVGGQAAGTPGFLGTTFGGRAGSFNGSQLTTFPAPRVNGVNSAMPSIEVVNNAGVLEGIPADMRGSGGGRGGDIVFRDTQDVIAIGNNGGAGGGSIVIVSRGGGFGANGEIETSGADGLTSSTGSDQRAGSGGGGAPGALLWMLDGQSVNFPILQTNLIALYGTSPITNGDATTPGKAPASAPVDLGAAAGRVQYVPVTRAPYPDYELDNGGGGGSTTPPEPAVREYMLTRANATAPSDLDGTNYDLSNTSGEYLIETDGVDDSALYNFSVVAPATVDGLTMSIDVNTGVYSVSGANWTGTEATFVLRATRIADSGTVDRTYTVTKFLGGNDLN